MENPVILKMGDIMNEEEFFRFCQMNDTLNLERDQYGNIIVMSPTGSNTGSFNLHLASSLYNWNLAQDFPGEVFDSSTGFTLPNGAVRSPDVSWVRKEKWEVLSPEDKERFAPVCPDFIIEVRSQSDELPALRDKMEEYIANGCQLGWLIDRFNQEVSVYRPQQSVEQFDTLAIRLSGEPVLPGFEIDLKKIINRLR
ncbi:Uma2 family endonuclease [Rhabdobacter roseus]|uniref:Uma2 family endonuclease n=1 Tax=Rhabdobacter roseus TaxID=1655419 RepID=A0A840TSU6_9BACT|nr:Uma2 family endonuclease [Rhabdobacter roseus]MBB5284642.1 Uma2 family endonuclease [Rhabdobacter roseus]